MIDEGWRLRRREPSGWNEVVPASSVESQRPIAVVAGGDRIHAISQRGAVYVYRDGASAWERLAAESAVFGSREGCVIAWDPMAQRLVAWGGSLGGVQSNETLSFASGEWVVCQAGSPLSERRTRRRKRGRDRAVSSTMLFDTHLGQLILFSGDDIAALQPAGWVAIECSDFRVDDVNRIVAHDAATKETLAICLKRRTVFRFDVSRCQHLCDIPEAGEHVDFVATDAERPLAADWLLDPAQRLTLFVDNDLEDSYRFDLGQAFDAAVARGDRSALPESKAHLLPAEVEPAVNEAAHAVLAAIGGDVVKKTTGLRARHATPGILRNVARSLWREVGPGAVGEFCGKAGIDLEALGLSAKDCESMFLDLVIAAMKSSKVDAKAASEAPRVDVCEPARWQNFGPARPTATTAVPPYRVDEPYVLAFDSTAGSLAYIRSRDRRWGETWHWNGSSWECAHSEAIKARSLGQRFRALDDPSRGGVACWSTDSERKQDRTARGVLVTSKGASEIASTGEIPTLSPEQRKLNHELLFAFDPTRAATVAVSSQGVWDLDKGGVWSKRCNWDLGNPLTPKWSEEKMADAGWDVINQRVLVWFPGEDNQFHFVAIVNDAPIEIPTINLPVDLYKSYNRAPIVGACGELGICVHTGASTGSFSLGGDGWTRIETDGANPPSARHCQAAYDPGRKTLMFGPGDYRSTDGEGSATQHVFYAHKGGQWQLHGSLQPSRQRPFHIEPFAVQDGRMVGTNRTNELFHWTDEEAWVRSPEPKWTAWSEMVAGGFRDTNGRLAVVTNAGGVYHLIDGLWQPRTVDRSDFGSDRFSIKVAYDPDQDRWLAYDLERYDKKSDTLLLSGDAWKNLDADSAVDPKPFDDSYSRGEFIVAYDSFLQCFVRVHPNAVFILSEGGWQKVKAAPKDAGLTGRELRAVHDPLTAETLIIDFETRRIGRFNVDQMTYLTTYELPGNFEEPTRGSANPVFSYTMKCPFDSDGRRLLVFDPDDHYGNFRLDLSTVFDASKGLGPRSKAAP